MSHWTFVIVAYAVTLLGTGGLLAWAYSTMRWAENRVEELKRPE